MCMKRRWAKRAYKFQGFLNYVYSLVLLRYSGFRSSLLKDQLARIGCDRLQIGCGNVILDHWLNVLYERRQEYGKLIQKGKGWFLNYNLLKPWPVADNSLAFVAGSHVIEHLDLNQGIKLLENAYRALKMGGVIRLSCPDLEKYAKAYVQKDKAFFNHPLIQEWCAFKTARTSGQIFIAKAYDSGGAHKWFYDFESLADILARAGFNDIKKVSRLEGEMPDKDLLEPAGRGRNAFLS